MKSFNRYWKAIVGFVAPGAVLIGSATMTETPGGESITQGELIRAVVAMVVTAAAVYFVPGDPARKVSEVPPSQHGG
jgi:uncharacterized protein (DUF362 family)